MGGGTKEKLWGQILSQKISDVVISNARFSSTGSSEGLMPMEMYLRCFSSKRVFYFPFIYRCISGFTCNSIEKLESFKKCVNCNKRLIQASAGLIVHCDKCDNTMRSSICEDGIWAKVVVSVNGENVHLVLFENTLRPFYEGKDPNLELLSQTLLLQDNLEITFNSETKIVSAIRSAPME